MGVLSGRTAIVVGAGSGLGRGTALRWSEEGANVIAADIAFDRVQDLVDEAGRAGYEGRVVAVDCDVDREEDLDRTVARAAEEFGSIDILFACAQGGLDGGENLLQASSASALFSYRTGPLYTLLLIQKVAPHFKAQGYGRIITVASGAALRATPGFVVYGMSKAAMLSLTRSSARELGPFGVTTNCILPVTLNDHFGEGTEGTASVEVIAKMSPVGYMGEPYKDASPILTFIASESASYLNGQIINIDGGLTV